jgi:kinesin family protein 11
MHRRLVKDDFMRGFQSLPSPVTQVARLRAQNDRLTELLEEEQQTSTRLRNDLVAQITSLLTGFTNAQSTSLDKAISGISSVNNQGITALDHALTSYKSGAELAAQRSDQYRVDLDLIRKTQASNRADATKVC